MKGTGGSRNGAEFQANTFSPARMLLFGPNSAPSSGQIPPSNPIVSRGFESPSLRHRVLISRYSPLESPNSARQRLSSNVNGSGENHIPANDARFASKVSAGKFGATVWAGRRKELGRTKGFENL